MDHGMTSDNARRVRLTGSQLKQHFINKYCDNGFLSNQVDLVQGHKLGNVIIKSGSNWQFRLGRIEEIISYLSEIKDDGKLVVFRDEFKLLSILISENFLSLYAFSTTFFVARNCDKWQIFLSKDIIELIRNKFYVRILKSGRIKYDYMGEKRKLIGVMTIEYRAEKHKRSFVFGAHGGGSGERLRSIFADELIFTEVPF